MQKNNNILSELVGQTIKSAEIKKENEHTDDLNILVLTMESGEVFEVKGCYGGYTGNSMDEYPQFVEVAKKELETVIL